MLMIFTDARSYHATFVHSHAVNVRTYARLTTAPCAQLRFELDADTPHARSTSSRLRVAQRPSHSETRQHARLLIPASTVHSGAPRNDCAPEHFPRRESANHCQGRITRLHKGDCSRSHITMRRLQSPRMIFIRQRR